MPSPVPTADVDSDPQTPTLASINPTVAYDWHRRANRAEQELSIEREKLKRSHRKTERLRHQVEEATQALERQVQDYARLAQQCQQLSNANITLLQQSEKGKLMVETLEAVIMMLYTHPLKEVVEAHRLMGKGTTEEGHSSGV